MYDLLLGINNIKTRRKLNTVLIDHFPATPIVPAQNPSIGKHPANIPIGGAGSGQYFIQGELWLGGWQQGLLGKLLASKQSRQINTNFIYLIE